MWNKVVDDWESDDQEEEELEVYCPFPMSDTCVHERCAWYLTERGECAVKVIARRYGENHVR